MTQDGPVCEGRRYRIRGLVQGVGFRPFVWRLAREEGVKGFVLNDGSGVLLEAFAAPDALARLEARLVSEAPALARIDTVETSSIDCCVPHGFEIRTSRQGTVSTGIVADAATCAACLAEMRDTSSRRSGYAFTNCTHCGPRLSIVRAIPYDRATTSMSVFKMCGDCTREYNDPGDRRFHAEPIACPHCGPQLWLESGGNLEYGNPIERAAELIERGEIVALKGIGGFQLACDALSDSAVSTLRSRKQRDAKSFAVMVRDLSMARAFANVSDEEAAALSSSAAPIVLLEARTDGNKLASLVAPDTHLIGLMLPSSPLHHLLANAVRRPLVMTSGNRSSEPQCTANDDARTQLATIAGAFLMHDRDIVNRLDDSVIRFDRTGPTFIRRARGFAPEPLRLGSGFTQRPSVLAMGGELKSTFCLLRDGLASLSQHLGDLEAHRTREEYRAALDLYRSIFDFAPDLVAVDLHPDYDSTRMGETVARELGAPLLRIQHHHAHLAACLADNSIGIDEASAHPVLGIILDGTGLGPDGSIWGGELLLGGYSAFERVGHLSCVALPGADRAAREPWRNTVAHIMHAFGDSWREALAPADPDGYFDTPQVAAIERMIIRGVNAPRASSVGRLFDAFAGLLGICRGCQAYEGQTGLILEGLASATRADIKDAYAFGLTDQQGKIVIGAARVWQAAVADLKGGIAKEAMAARFHHGLVDAFVSATLAIAKHHKFGRVVLSGGVFANRILLEGLAEQLTKNGFEVLTHQKTPANDGGLSLGQACIAAAASNAGYRSCQTTETTRDDPATTFAKADYFGHGASRTAANVW